MDFLYLFFLTGTETNNSISLNTNYNLTRVTYWPMLLPQAVFTFFFVKKLQEMLLFSMMIAVAVLILHVTVIVILILDKAMISAITVLASSAS